MIAFHLSLPPLPKAPEENMIAFLKKIPPMESKAQSKQVSPKPSKKAQKGKKKVNIRDHAAEADDAAPDR
ncbi:hypothetical protein MMC18_004659 [Xylographa bjoerkii]|nr:hypothetical protein [Xylographa bjoerkii]